MHVEQSNKYLPYHRKKHRGQGEPQQRGGQLVRRSIEAWSKEIDDTAGKNLADNNHRYGYQPNDTNNIV